MASPRKSRKKILVIPKSSKVENTVNTENIETIENIEHTENDGVEVELEVEVEEVSTEIGKIEIKEVPETCEIKETANKIAFKDSLKKMLDVNIDDLEEVEEVEEDENVNVNVINEEKESNGIDNISNGNKESNIDPVKEFNNKVKDLMLNRHRLFSPQSFNKNEGSKKEKISNSTKIISYQNLLDKSINIKGTTSSSENDEIDLINEAINYKDPKINIPRHAPVSRYQRSNGPVSSSTIRHVVNSRTI